jgi:hypothetical protein
MSDLPDGLADQIGKGAGASGGHPVPGCGPHRGHDRGREYVRVQVTMPGGTGPLGDHRGERLVGERPAGHVHRVGDVFHPDVLQSALKGELQCDLGQCLPSFQLLALAKASACCLCRGAVHDTTVE